MNKVLLVTGQLAGNLVRKYAEESGVECEVRILPVPVASFITPKKLLDELRGIDSGRYSMILLPDIPSLTDSDLKRIEEELKVPVFRGPKSASDIPSVLNNLGRLDLSRRGSLQEFLMELSSARVPEELRLAEGDVEQKLLKPFNFRLGKGMASIPVGPDFPPRIIAEICDAPMRSDDEIIETVRRYLRQGAEIIDIGMVAGDAMPQEIPRIVSLLRENFDVPLSINTIDEAEIEKAIECGIDLIVSICGSTIENFEGLKVPAVLIPIDPRRGYYPRDPSEKLKYLLDLLEEAKELGYQRVIADLILEPVNMGFVGSLTAFYELRRLRPEVPILMGIGNVVELFDADSVGITALLLGAVSEVGANLVLTTEGSDKTVGCISEAVRARDMMTLAKRRDSVPKDLGLDLLILKDKRRFFEPYDQKIEEGAEVIRAAHGRKFGHDSEEFRIFVDKSEIVVVLQTCEGPKVIKGKSAEEICHEILDRGLVTQMSHAAYLGRELQKAEIALRTGKGYLQGKEIF